MLMVINVSSSVGAYHDTFIFNVVGVDKLAELINFRIYFYIYTVP